MPSDVSVVVPFHNREGYIDQAIQSVMAQTLAPLEIIIVNDGSQEASRSFLDRYAGICVVVDLPVTVGVASARNEGVRRARGRYIAFLDDDDIWLPEKLAAQRKYMNEHPECSVVHSGGWVFSADKPDTLHKCEWPRPLTLAQALTHEYWVVTPTMLMRSEVAQALGGFDPRFRGSEDHEFIIRCCAAGYRIEAIHQPLIRIRREGHNSLTRRRWWRFTTHARLWWKHRALYYQAYGARGSVSFLLSSLHLASMETRYLDGAVRFLCRIIKVKWKIKPGYHEPVRCEG